VAEAKPHPRGIVDLDLAASGIGHHHRHLAVLEDPPEFRYVGACIEYGLDGRGDGAADML
jgi:hypothetical protein